MKGMKKIIMVLMVLSLIVVFAGQSIAGEKWQTCKVSGVLCTEEGVVQIALERSDLGESKFFNVPSGQENMMVAIALSAMSMGSTVEAYIDWSQKVSEQITVLKIVPTGGAQ